jgi:ubiquinone/menaquinone biosynthesis C-methylase UbiE
LSNPKFYENKEMQKTLGDTLRPGGLVLTKRAMDYCKFSHSDSLLDLGCGKGTTIKYISDYYKVNIAGLDISDSLVKEARSLNENVEIVKSSGESTPFQDNTFNGVFAECTLSLMDNLQNTIREINRIMKNKGYLVISDIYANNTGHLDELRSYSVKTCLKNPHDIEELKQLLNNNGFKILLEEKHDHYMKQLVVDIIFGHKNMAEFWNCTGGCCIDGKKFQESLIKSKLGYFFMIAEKEENSCQMI